MQLVYSTAPADWVEYIMCQCTKYHETTNYMAWNILVTWYKCLRLVLTKILENLWLNLVHDVVNISLLLTAFSSVAVSEHSSMLASPLSFFLVTYSLFTSSFRCTYMHHHQFVSYGGACGVMIIVIGNGHGDTSSNPRRDRLHFTSH